MSGGDGRLFDNIREKLGMAYAVGSYFMPGIERGYHIFYAMTSAQNIHTVKKALIKEIQNLKNKGVSEKELESAKRYLIASDTADLQRNEALSLKMSLDELYGLGYNNFEAYSSEIKGVTAGQVKRVSNQYFEMKNTLIVIIYGKQE